MKRAEQLLTPAYLALLGRTMALPVERDHYRHTRATVVEVADIAPHLRRISLHAPLFGSYRRNGPDEYVGLFLPRPGHTLVLPRDDDGPNIRRTIRDMPEAQRPELRWYTVRHHRRADCEIDLDIVTHGDAGPGTAWAVQAAPGQVIGLREGSAAYTPPAPGERQVLVADETALPALAAIGEHLVTVGADATAITAVVEIPDDTHHEPVSYPFAVHTCYRVGLPGDALQAALERHRLAPHTAWIAGEATMVARVRSHLVKRCGVPKRQVFYSGYWKLGEARG